MSKLRVKPNYRRRVLRLPDLDHCKSAVLNSLGSPASRRVYEYAIDQFIAWYCSEPRLAFNRIVVVRYRLYLESRHLAANTINQQLAAVRRLAHEAADAGLLSPELAAGISRVKGVKQLGFRSGNWLSAEQSSEVLKHACGDSMRAKRDYAMFDLIAKVAIFAPCPFRTGSKPPSTNGYAQPMSRREEFFDESPERERCGAVAYHRTLCGTWSAPAV
jgi:hypothetical protein